FSNMALVVGLFSYNGGLYWGLNADWEQIPDLHDFIVALEDAFSELQAAARAASDNAATPTRRKRRRGQRRTGRAWGPRARGPEGLGRCLSQTHKPSCPQARPHARR